MGWDRHDSYCCTLLMFHHLLYRFISCYLFLHQTKQTKKKQTKQQQKQQRKVDKRKQSTETKKIKCRTSAMIGQLPTFFQYKGNSKPGIFC